MTAIGGGCSLPASVQPYVGLEYVIVMYARPSSSRTWQRAGRFFRGRPIGWSSNLDAFPAQQLQNTAIFVVFLVIVLLRPQGLFGRAGADMKGRP